MNSIDEPRDACREIREVLDNIQKLESFVLFSLREEL